MTMRSVDTRFWEDGWVRKLNALDRYVFLYFLTNTHTNWCGVYELDIAMMAFECGIDKEDLERAILPRLSPKVIYFDGWVVIANYGKYHNSNTLDAQKGYEKALKSIPERIRLKIKEMETSGGTPPTTPSFALASAFASTLTSEAELRIEKDTPKKEEKESTAKYPHKKEVFALWGTYPKNWELNTTQCRAAENLYAEKQIDGIKSALRFYGKHKNEEFCPQINNPYDLDSKWEKLLTHKNKRT